MIHTEYWGLSFAPFSNDRRQETFVPTKGAGRVVSRLRYALGREMGASALQGDAGVGKTRLARMIIDEFLAARWLAAYFPGPRGNARDILSRLDPEAAERLDPASSGLTELEAFLGERALAGQPCLLVVDDVQAVRGTEFLELLRSLLNLQPGGRPALSILLVGQPGTERRLAAASALDSQLATRAVLEPMTPDEARLYILARLKAAGSKQGIFTKNAADRVVELSGGVPRQVNRLCEMSLVIAHGLNEHKITPEIVDMAAGDLDLLPGEDAPFHPWPHLDAEAMAEAGGGTPPTARPAKAADPEEFDILAALPADAAAKTARHE